MGHAPRPTSRIRSPTSILSPVTLLCQLSVHIVFFQETLKKEFPSKTSLEGNKEVVTFVMQSWSDDPHELMRQIYEEFVELRLKNTRESINYLQPLRGPRWLKYLCQLSEFPVDPLHNKYIHIFNHKEDYGEKRSRDTTPVFTLSRYYQFYYMKEDVQCDIQHKVQEADEPECCIYIEEPDGAVAQSLFTTCHNISRHRPVTDLHMWEVKCGDLPAAVEVPVISGNAQSLWLCLCDLPVRFIRNILRQLIDSDCVSLKLLDLWRMDLSPWEGELDELMEQLVSHHEAGEAQENLLVKLGDKDSYIKTNLSTEFKEKWRRRCEGITSISCGIYD